MQETANQQSLLQPLEDSNQPINANVEVVTRSDGGKDKKKDKKDKKNKKGSRNNSGDDEGVEMQDL